MAEALKIRKRPCDQSSDEEDEPMAEQKDNVDQGPFKKRFVPENMSDGIRNAQYAVRGAIVKRAYQIKADLESADKDKYAFSNITFCNIGNPQAFVKPPITFHRQVQACVLYPALMTNDAAPFPKDVVDRAQRLLDSTAHQNIGAYTNSRGLLTVRESVAEYLHRRDGFKANAEHIFLTTGASAGIKYTIQCLASKSTDGILIPIPQYPLYSATITLCGGTAVPYYLDESKDWKANLKSIEDAIQSAKGITIGAIAVINPGNPTGQCFDKATVDGIIGLAQKYNLLIMADEVYQENIWYKDEFPFVSFRKCLLSSAAKDSVELISYHSVSKGIFGECGLRGGYMELINIDKAGLNMLVKLVSIGLCPNTIGQCMVDMMVNPPRKGDASYKQFEEEYRAQYESLRERAAILTKQLNAIDGVSCNTVFGALYAFPNIEISKDTAANAKAAYKETEFAGKEVDFIYCLELLERYGICVVPGSGFGQKEGSYHFRITLLPPKDHCLYVVKSLAMFNQEFMKKYSVQSD